MIMYAVDGSEDIGETVLEHLEGYRGSRPGPDRQRRGRASASSTSTAS